MSRRTPGINHTDNLTSRSINMLIAQIRNGELKRGEKLLPQNVMAKKLGISRTALREALQELSYRGIIDSQHGRGTFVCDNMVHEEEVLEARLILEPRIAGIAAARATEQELDGLDDVCRIMDRLVKERNPEEFSDRDLEFHSAIGAMSRNLALTKLLASVKDMMLHQQNVVQIIPGAMERAYIFHLEITRALCEHKPETAEDAMRRHLEDVIMTLKASNCHKEKSSSRRMHAVPASGGAKASDKVSDKAEKGQQ